MPTPLAIINRAFRLAIGVGVDATVQPVLDNVWAFEEAFPLALRRAIKETPLSAEEVEGWRREHSLTLVNGEIAMPDAVLEEFFDSSSVYLAADLTARISFAPRWTSYLHPAHDQLGYYTYKEDNFHYREAGGEPFDFDGDVKLVCISLPNKPANISTNMTLPVDLAGKTVEVLADMIRGRSA